MRRGRKLPWEDAACRPPVALSARSRQRARHSQRSFHCLERHHEGGEQDPRRVFSLGAAACLRAFGEPPPSAAYAQTCRGRVSNSQQRERRQRSRAVLHGVNLPKGKLLKRQPAAAVGVERVQEVARGALNLRGRGAGLAVGRKQRGRLLRVNLPRAVCAGEAGGEGWSRSQPSLSSGWAQKAGKPAAAGAAHTLACGPSAAARPGRETPASARSNVSLSCTSTSGSNICSSFGIFAQIRPSCSCEFCETKGREKFCAAAQGTAISYPRDRRGEALVSVPRVRRRPDGRRGARPRPLLPLPVTEPLTSSPVAFTDGSL
jgi:hypothetical protein